MDITIKLEYTVRDLANLCNCTEQTIRNKVKEARQKGMLTSRIDRKEIAYKTGKDYLKIVDTKIKSVFGNIRIDELNGQNLNEFTQSLTTVINKTRTVLKQTLDHLYRLEKTEKKLFDLCVCIALIPIRKVGYKIACVKHIY